MRRVSSLLFLGIFLAAGCGGPPSQPSQSGAGGQAQATGKRPPPLPPNLTQAAPPEQPNVTREKAVVGVGKKGQGYGGGVITEPISVYFRAPQMMTFKIQIPDAMNKYRGVNGHFPKTHEEFMEKIIKENMISLPDLPDGARYVYDPKKAAEMREYDPADPPLFVERRE